MQLKLNINYKRKVEIKALVPDLKIKRVKFGIFIFGSFGGYNNKPQINSVSIAEKEQKSFNIFFLPSLDFATFGSLMVNENIYTAIQKKTNLSCWQH